MDATVSHISPSWIVYQNPQSVLEVVTALSGTGLDFVSWFKGKSTYCGYFTDAAVVTAFRAKPLGMTLVPGGLVMVSATVQFSRKSQIWLKLEAFTSDRYTLPPKLADLSRRN